MSTTAETSKQVARSLYEGYNTHDLNTVFNKYVSQDLVNHAMGGALSRESWLQYDIAVLAAVPDLKATVLDQVAEENKVFTHWIFAGTHTSNLFDKPATGNQVRLEAVTIDIIKDGKVVEHNIIADVSTFMQSFETK
jgi:predicted ester cyclase